MKLDKKVIYCFAVVFGLAVLPLQAGVTLDFTLLGGSHSSVTDGVTLDSLSGTVTVASDTGVGTPTVDAGNNTLSGAGVSGAIKLNFESLDAEGGSAFSPDNWTGGGQAAGNSIWGGGFATGPFIGWGIRTDAKANGYIQSGELLIMTFDFSALNLLAGQSVVLQGVTFFDNGLGRNGDLWMRDTDVAVGVSGAGVQLADNTLNYTGNVVVKDGDKLAIMRGEQDTGFTGLTLDVIEASASVVTDFNVAGVAASSVDLTWSNLTGTVTVASSVEATPLIDSEQNTLTSTAGLSGAIKMNILAVDDLPSNFVPATWSGGGQSAGNSVSASTVGWGVRRDGKINGALQDPGEALILTFDLSALTLGERQSVVLKGITFWGDTDGSRNGDIWMRGTTGASVQLADSVITYSSLLTGLTISDGDHIALRRGSKDTRLASLELDVIAVSSVKIHPLFYDHAVLQRDLHVPVWGTADPGDTVNVMLDDEAAGTAIADENGNWLMRLDPHADDGGTPHVLKITSEGNPDIKIKDVVFGDVYLVSGQSNMDRTMLVEPVIGYNEEVSTANQYSLIRHVKITHLTSETELSEPPIDSPWTPCSTTALAEFSATGYFFAKAIYLETAVPVGLIHCAWVGKAIEPFISPSGLAAVPELAGMRQYKQQGGVGNLHDIYNAMIASLIPYGVRGAIWYQGETNAGVGDGDIYQFKMQALMRGWRENWGQGNFPFYYVQLANYAHPTADWPGLRNAQFRALSETNSGMAVTIDVGDDTRIHPQNKFDTGSRLARWALDGDLGFPMTCSGPLYFSSSVESTAIRVLFEYANDGLMVGTKDGLSGSNPVEETTGPLQNFEIAGANKNFVAATAVIDRDSVVVSSPQVTSPVYVRYCYDNTPDGANKLYNTAGLPASPFTSAPVYDLEVISGTGSSTDLSAGQQMVISANAPPDGQVFDRWIGAVDEVNNLTASSATVTMPDHSLYLLATYRGDTETAYRLTVNRGSGSGTAQPESLLTLEAAAPAEGQMFDYWSGDTQTVTHVKSPVTTLRMPTANIAVTAVYRTLDSVGDGVVDTWRAGYFGGEGTTTNADSTAEADPDGDGVSNADEYLAGTSPTDASSILKLASTVSGRDLILNFPTISSRRYSLEKTDSLIDPVWQTLVFNVTGDGTVRQIRYGTDTGADGFFHLRVND